MSWLTLWAFLNIGWIEASIWDNGYGVFKAPEPSYFVEYGVVLEVDRFSFIASMENMFFKDDTDRIVGGFSPFHDAYKVEGRFKFNNTFTLIANHKCEHTVNVGDSADEILKYDAAESRVFLNTRIGL